MEPARYVGDVRAPATFYGPGGGGRVRSAVEAVGEEGEESTEEPEVSTEEPEVSTEEPEVSTVKLYYSKPTMYVARRGGGFECSEKPNFELVPKRCSCES